VFKRILLPLDLTEKHTQAQNIVAQLAMQTGGEVTLLHVIEEIQGIAIAEEQEFFNRLERSAREHLERVGGQFPKGVSWRSEIRYGTRAQEVANYARGIAADLIVVTAPRLDSDLPGSGWGSLSWKIGILGPCPVLLVK
jgi:nucleotide-binding universal stress UspA family protein